MPVARVFEMVNSLAEPTPPGRPSMRHQLPPLMSMVCAAALVMESPVAPVSGRMVTVRMELAQRYAGSTIGKAGSAVLRYVPCNSKMTALPAPFATMSATAAVRVG